MLNWLLRLVFDSFDSIFVVADLDPKYKELNCILERQKFLIFWGKLQRSQAKFLIVVSYTADLNVLSSWSDVCKSDN